MNTTTTYLKPVTFRFKQILAISCALSICPPMYSRADQPQAIENNDAVTKISNEELESLIAPIALYPDTLLSQVLVASTYPLELVEAQQWLDRNSALKGEALTKAAQEQQWDASIQALVIFPDVLKRLTQDISWTTRLGNAFLNQQSDVMDSVQRLRVSAQASGKLQSGSQQKIVTSAEGGQTVIEIQQTNPDVIYVPYYDPVVVWGPRYYAYPTLYYPPSAVIGASIFWFGAAVVFTSAFGGWYGGGWGWRPYWHNRTVVVNNVFIDRYHFRSRGPRFTVRESTWSHDRWHRQGVSYRDRGYHDRPGFNRSEPRSFNSGTGNNTLDRIRNRNSGFNPQQPSHPSISERARPTSGNVLDQLRNRRGSFERSQSSSVDRPAAPQRTERSWPNRPSSSFERPTPPERSEPAQPSPVIRSDGGNTLDRIRGSRRQVQPAQPSGMNRPERQDLPSPGRNDGFRADRESGAREMGQGGGREFGGRRFERGR